MEKESILLKSNGKIIQLIFDSLNYVEVNDYLVTFYVDLGGKHSCCKSLKSIAEKLPANFFQINRSCLVNCKKIKEIDLKNRILTLQSGHTLSVSKTHIRKFFEMIRKENIYIS